MRRTSQRRTLLLRHLSILAVLALVLTACPADEPDVAEPEPEPVDEPEPDDPDEPEPDEPDEPAEEGEPYRIGMIAALSGPASSLGIPEGNTAQMLEEQINAEGGILGPDGLMHPLEIIVLDTQSEETETLLATRQLIEVDEVPVIVGPTQSGTSMAIIDTIQEAEIPLISMAAAAAIVTPVEERHWVFKTPQDDRLVQAVLSQYFQGQGYENIAWMSVDTGFGDTGRAVWMEMAPEEGFNVVADERFGAEDTDMTAQLTRIAQTDADAILVWTIPPSASVVARNWSELDLDIPLYQSHGVGNRAYIDLAEGAAEGTRFAAGKLLVADTLPDDDPQKELLLSYIEDYEAMFGEGTWSTFGGHGWDAIMMAVEALGACGEDRACIRDYVETEIRDFVGISGVFNMSPDDHMGLDTDALVVIEIQDDDWVFVE